jgi:hypothetical protein
MSNESKTRKPLKEGEEAMKKIALMLLVAGLVLPLAAGAQEKTKVKVKVEVEVTVDDLTALSEVPNTLDAAREAGSTETEITKGYGAMKTVYIKGTPSLKVAEHFKAQAEQGYSDEGLGDLIKECVDKGLKDEALVKCVIGKTKKNKKPHPVVKAIPKGKPVVTVPVAKPDIKTPPPKKLDKEAAHVAEPTGAMKGKKLGGKIKK